MLIFITGFMGSGKSHLFSSWMAESKGVTYDFDHELAARLNISADELGCWIEANSWQSFRALEREILLEAMSLKEGLFSLGGGTLHANKDLCTEIDRIGTRVWLDTPAETCWKRVGSDQNRPLVKKGEQEFMKLFDERLELYKSANISISGESPLPTFSEFCNKYRNYLKID